MKVKDPDVQRALEVIKRDYLKSTGLDRDDFSENAAVFNIEAEQVICPACSTRFTPTSQGCPECGLQFG